MKLNQLCGAAVIALVAAVSLTSCGDRPATPAVAVPTQAPQKTTPAPVPASRGITTPKPGPTPTATTDTEPGCLNRVELEVRLSSVEQKNYQEDLYKLARVTGETICEAGWVCAPIEAATEYGPMKGKALLRQEGGKWVDYGGLATELAIESEVLPSSIAKCSRS